MRGSVSHGLFSGSGGPPIERSKRRRLLDIAAIAICAVIWGADLRVCVEMFGRSKEERFRAFQDLPNGIPSRDTFGDVLSRLDPEQFQHCFVEWTQAAVLMPRAGGGDRREDSAPFPRPQRRHAVHLASAWESANTLTLGKVRTEEKPNGTTDMPRLLEMLEPGGCLPASRRTKAGCAGMLETCSRVGMDQAGRPAPRLRRHPEQGTRTDRTAGAPGGRRDRLPGIPEHCRGQARAVPGGEGGAPPGDGGWSYAQDGYCISSPEAPVQRQLAATRGHRGTGNSLRWSLDVTFREGRSRARKDHGPRNMAALKQVSRNLLKRETGLKAGIRGKWPRAGWREDCLPKSCPARTRLPLEDPSGCQHCLIRV